MADDLSQDSIVSENGIDENTFRILIATDIHLGFMERHHLRGDDSFIAFEEILNHALEQKVDFILLGGDLFHENKPSRSCIQRCLDLLRKYCLGEASNSFQFLSDPEVNFKECCTPNVNFEDPNLSICLPIFSIHGNHDDPCGEGNYSIMDLLASTGFVNYFGKVPNFESLSFAPIVLKKGDTHVAIYGVGSMNDDRLFRLFEEEKVQFEVPADIDDECFNIMVLHQNRARHGCKSYAGEHFLPSFMHLVFWGHEHECRIDPEDSLDEFRITQPGSSVATSLSPGEAVPKHVGLLTIKGTEFFIEKLPLRTVRPFVFDTIRLEKFSSVGSELTDDEVVGTIQAKVKEMLEEAQKLVSGHPRQPTIPLLRLRVESDSEEAFARNNRDINIRLDLRDTVANPEDVVKLVRKRAVLDKIKTDVDEEAWDAVFNMESINMVKGHLESLLVDYYQESANKTLSVMHERTLAEAVRYYVEKNHDEAFRDIINLQANKTREQLKETVIGPERANFREAFEELRLSRNDNADDIVSEARSWLSGEMVKTEPNGDSSVNGANETAAVDVPMEESPTAVRGRGRARRARGATTAASGRARGRTRGLAAHQAAKEEDITIDNDSEDEFILATRPTPRQATKPTSTRGARGAGGSTKGGAAPMPIAQAFARQAASQSSQTPSTASRPARKPEARGVCYISDSD